MNEKTKCEAPSRYEEPAIVFEGALEIQAGSPLGLPDALDLDDWEA